MEKVKPHLRLLLVDDDDVDRERVRRMLASSGLKVSIEEAANVNDSISLLTHSDYDCIIVDYRLGVEDGLSLLNSIRQQLAKQCAVIIVTGLGDEEVAAEAMRLGASDYLVKNQLKSSQLLHAVLNSVHRAELTQKVHELAHYDNLTGLVSRHLLLDRLKQSITFCAKKSQLAALAFIDLDNFKPVNDTYGHEIGDQVLIKVANRLKNSVRDTDTVARLGGDEFVLLLNNINSAEECETLLLRTINELAAPIVIPVASCQVEVSASIGVTLVYDDSVDPDTILRRADQTMYQAKNNGRDKILFFDPEEEQRIQTRKQLMFDAERGIAQNEFVLHYQPKIDLRTGDVIGCEALIRWNHPQHGLIYPGDFSEALEHSSLGLIIGEWVLQEAVNQRMLWPYENLTVSVNIAPAHLLTPLFVDKLARLLRETPQMNPANLELEVLESVSIQKVERARDILQRCAALGVKVALDDFGTGYASLSYLKKLPLNTLKIDKSFILNMASDHLDSAIVESVVALSKAFKYQLIAEGIETEHQLTSLLQLGCYYGQGFYIAKPMPQQEFILWITQHNANQADVAYHTR